MTFREKVLFMDMETTGTDPWNHDPIDTSYIVTDTEYKEIDRIRIRNAPDFLSYWGVEAEKVHRITREEASSWQSRKEACLETIRFFESNDISPLNTYLVIMANPNSWWDKKKKEKVFGWFDWSFLFSMFWKEDLIWLFRRHIVMDPHHNVQTLWTYLKRFKIDKNIKAACDYMGHDFTDHHDSMADTEALIECWKFFQMKDRNMQKKDNLPFGGE